MTNNDELALKLKAAAEKAGIEEWQVKRNGPGEYEVMVKGSLVKHSGWSTHRPVVDEVVDKKTADFIACASPANLLALLAERDADKKLIAELEESLEKAQSQSSKWLEAYHKAVSVGARYEERIAELEARTVSVKLPDNCEHDVIAPVCSFMYESGLEIDTADYKALVARVRSEVETVMRRSLRAAGIKLDVGGVIMTVQLSQEQVENLLKYNDGSDSPANAEAWEVNALCRMLLAGMDSEPVAKVDNIGVCWYADDGISRKPAVGSPLYAAPPAPVAVPDKWPEKLTWSHHDDMTQAEVLAWNNAIDACRAAMQAEPVTAATVSAGWKLVPVEPTEAMMLHKSGCQHHAWDDADCAMRQTRRLVWAHMLAAAPAAPEQEV